eukprot:01303.XXX_1659_843_1 [CDS] Oithona nana genome sequencing.
MDISHELFSCFAFYSGLVLAKTLLMSFWTAKRRFAVGVFANPEDIKGTPNKVDFASEDVERVRRCHLNDLENVLPFVLLGGLYITTNPVLSTAKLVFRTFVAARFLHTFVYVFAVPQPSRALAFFVNQGCNMYMVYCIVSKNIGHM